MHFIAHLIHHFRNMILLRKVLILIGAGGLFYGIYLLITVGYQWPENRLIWLFTAASLFVLMSQWLAHLHDIRKPNL